VEGSTPPLPARSPDLRIGDTDRERAASVLRDHMVEGRLTLEEYIERLDDVFAANSERELVVALRELPERSIAPPTPKRRAWLVTLIGSVQRRGRWTAPRRILAFSLLGAPDFDFRHASVAEDVRITSISVVGALTAVVPAGVEVDMGGLALVGGNDVQADADAGRQPPSGGPLIRIRSYALLGGARVTFVSPDAGVLPR
jgi:hypothetical protein